MTPAEREALLKLWEDCPETRAKGMHIFRSVWFGRNQCSLDDDHAAAIARDAMVEYVIAKMGAVTLGDRPVEEMAERMHSSFTGNSTSIEKPSRLLCLVAACRKIAGKEST